MIKFQVRHPLSDIPTHVSCAEMADALEMKFQAIIETPQKNTDGPSVVQPRKFNMQTKQHLVMRMKPNNQGFLPLDNFMKVCVFLKFGTLFKKLSKIVKKGRKVSN